MLITVLHPELLPEIAAYPAGLHVPDVPNSQFPVLVLKMPKEYILAAKIRKGFQFHFVPVLVDGIGRYGLISIFPDDQDEPLAFKTPLFEEPWVRKLIDTISSGTVDIHFFDELTREQLVYRSNVSIPTETRAIISSLQLHPYSHRDARWMLEGMAMFFRLRTADDSKRAIEVSLEENLFVEDVFIQDLRPGLHAYHGARGHSYSMLERLEPGSFQEEDIVQCLQMVFPAHQIYHSPKRLNDDEEICDILVVTQSIVLILQAKDSPNTEVISRQSVARKRKSAFKALTKAVDQLKGAAAHLRNSGGSTTFSIQGKEHVLDLSRKRMLGMAVVKELFNNEYVSYSNLLLGLALTKDLPSVALDYPELYMYCKHLQSEQEFMSAFDQVYTQANLTGAYPRLRFGLSD